MGSPSEILLFRPAHFQMLLAYSDSVQEDLSTKMSKNMQEIINLTVKKPSIMNLTTKNKH